MTTVDPYLLPLPNEITKSDGTPTEEFTQWLIYNNRFSHDLWRAITDGTGEVVPGETSETDSDLGAIGGISDILPIFIINSDFTTTGSQNIFCTNTSLITITMNNYPDDGERVAISRRNSVVKVSGAVNGTTEKIIDVKYSTMVVIYSAELGEWSIT